MTRTILTISNRDGVLDARVEKGAPPLPKNWNERVPFGYGAAALPPLTDAAQLEQYGSTLAQGLRQHPAIAQVLQQAFGAAAQQSHSLCFMVEADEGRQIRWEALRNEQGAFVALEGRCHIGRIARSVSAEDSPRLFTPPLKLLAFLSGTGLDATQEWDSLAAAFDKARARGLPVAADVRIGQPALLAQVQGECAAGLHPAITVGPMPADTLELEDQVRTEQPHILHFFCHGKANMGAAFLELATVKEQALGDPGTIVLAIDTLAQLGLRNTWLVVLNCCEGGHATEELDSMAERLVSESGLAAAIGMLEPVAVGEASRFCGVLYPELFHLLEGVLKMAPGTLPQRVDLSPALSRPRRALRDLVPPLKAGARWTLPVLYQQEQPFQVFHPLGPVAPVAPAAPVPAPIDWAVVRAKAETVAGMLAGLPPDTPAQARDGMLALLDEAPVVPAALRPDRWGRFGQGGAGLGG